MERADEIMLLARYRRKSFKKHGKKGCLTLMEWRLDYRFSREWDSYYKSFKP